MKELRRRGQELPMPSPQDEPPYLTFLRAFAQEVEDYARSLDLPGHFHWRPVRPLANLIGVEMWFQEKDAEEPTHYLVLRSPPFMQRDMVKIEEMGHAEDGTDYVIMEADPKAILAYITF